MKTTLLFAILTLLLPGKVNPVPQIVPMPESITMDKGSVNIAGAAILCDNTLSEKSTKFLNEFALLLTASTGKTSVVVNTLGLKNSIDNRQIKGFAFTIDGSIPAEGYEISIDDKFCVVKASDDHGVFYAIQTIKQMLPAAIYGNSFKEKQKWELPCCTIKDAPRFAYRGMHLDCSRHFFSIDEVKKYLDIMAMYKLNTFHWHLTDDQGWRIEIKKYPKLVEVGAFRDGTAIGKDYSTNDGLRYGGFYTQSQIKEIIEYADKRCITVIPEIDLPGHMLAALAAYPELGCTGGPYKVWYRWGVSDQVLCPGKEKTFTFLEGVLTEVANLFPSEYIHIGGDECKKTEWEKCPDCQAKIKELGIVADEHTSAEQYLQNYVTTRIQDFLAKKGKKVIGWDEIIDGNVSNSATIMSWRGTKGGIKAAKNGFDAIMCPYSHCYFDYVQGDPDKEPLGGGRIINWQKTYSFEPLEGLTPEEGRHILGVQANLWTEFISTNEHLEYMLLPRMLAISEVQWCIPSNKNEDRFRASLTEHQFPILDIMGYNYRKDQ